MMKVGHFDHGHFGLGRFGPDISDMDISATKGQMWMYKCGRFGHNHKLWVGDGSIHVYIYACVMPYLGLTVYIFLLFISSVLEALGYEKM